MIETDIVIVGGGSAGCVLANRLSAMPSVRVMLIEAGRDTAPGQVPDDIADVFPRALANPGYFWSGLKAKSIVGRAPAPFPQARVMGGGSSVTGLFSLRGLRADYDSWSQHGARGWSYDEVLPYFKRVESDLDFASDAHGSTGPVTLQRTSPDQWPGFNQSIKAAALKRGFRLLDDGNADDSDGVFSMPLATDGKARVSAASAYLTNEIRRRPNLEIRPDTNAVKVRLENGRAVGVELRRADGTSETIRAALTILSCGALHSPALLFRSGIGPGTLLSQAGLKVEADLSSVGKNLQNHLFAHLAAIVRPHARQTAAERRYSMAGIRLSSEVLNAPKSDLFIGFISRTGAARTGNRLVMLAAILNAPLSRGAVTPDPAAPFGPPLIDFSMLSDPSDRERLVKAADVARRLMEDAQAQGSLQLPFVVSPNPPLRLLNGPGWMPKLLGLGIATAFGRGSPIKKSALRFAIGPGRLLSELADQESFAEQVIASATPQFHPVGTCAIGSVVDSAGRVKGIAGLRVIDASIIPVIPRGNTNLPTLMVAEKCADDVVSEFKGVGPR